jgi:membrane protein DedA with SNARE-associated domain
MRFAPYVTLTAIGAAIWAFAIAGVGWALGSSYERFNHGFRYADYVVAAGFALLVAYVVWRKLRSSTLSRRDGTREDPAR